MSWKDNIAKPHGYPHNDWPQAVYLERAERHIEKLEEKYKELETLADEAMLYINANMLEDDPVGVLCKYLWEK